MDIRTFLTVACEQDGTGYITIQQHATLERSLVVSEGSSAEHRVSEG